MLTYTSHLQYTHTYVNAYSALNYYGSVMIRAAMLQLADQKPALSAQKESAVQDVSIQSIWDHMQKTV